MSCEGGDFIADILVETDEDTRVGAADALS